MNEITKPAQTDVVAQATPVQEGPGALLAAIVQLAKDPAIDVAKLGKLMEMQERMEMRDAERQYNEAMHRVQQRLRPMLKRGTVDLGTGKGSYKFLRREDLDEELRPIATEEGFSWNFTQKPASSGGMTVYIHVRHVAGHTETSEMELPADNGPGRSPLQARVSTISFCERVLTEMAFNVVRKGTDDDGVLGGKKFITEQQIGEIIAGLQEIGRHEGPFLDQLFAGQVRSVEEIEDGQGFLTVISTINGIKRRQQKGTQS